jgi:hypothetical protein
MTETGELLHEEYHFKQRRKPLRDTANGAREFVLNPNLTESRKLDLLESASIAYRYDSPNNSEVLARANLSRKLPVRLEVISYFRLGLSVAQRSLFQTSFGARSPSM